MADVKVIINLNKLPSGYQQVSYIQSDGYSYIDTGYKPKSSHKIMAYTENLGTDQQVFGVSDGINSTSVKVTNDGSYWTNVSWGAGGVATRGEVYYGGKIGLNKNYFVIDESVLTVFEYQNFNIDKNLFLFSLNNNGVATNISSNIRINYFEVYDNKILLMRLIPCYRTSDNKTGFYDIISGNFFSNSGTGNLIKGDDFEDSGLLELEFDKSFIKNVESLHQLTSDASEISSGMLANTGSVELLNKNNLFTKLVNNGIFVRSGLPLTILVGDSLVQQHEIMDTNYNPRDNSFTFELSNFVANFDKNKIVNTLINKRGKPLGELIDDFLQNDLQLYVDESASIYDYDNMPTEVYDFLNRIKLYLTTYNITGTEFVDKLLELSRMYFCVDEYGYYRIISSRPVLNPNEPIINIPKNMCFSILNKDIFVNNNYNNVSHEINNIKESIENIYNRTYTIYKADENLQEEITGEFISSDAFVETSDVSQNKVLGFYLTITSNNPLYNFNFTHFTRSNKMFKIKVSGVLGSGNEINYEFEHNGGFMAYVNSNGFNPHSRAERVSYGSELYILEDKSTENSHTLLFLVSLNDYAETLDPQTYQPIPRSETFRPREINVLVRSDTYNILSENISLNSNEFEYLMANNRFLNNNCKYTNMEENETNLFESIANSIVYDYSNGVKKASISISCGDLYYQNGELAKQWQAGEIIKVGEAIKIYSDPTIWRVTGRKFRYSGCPFIDLELQEIRDVLDKKFLFSGFDENGYSESSQNYDGVTVEYMLGHTNEDNLNITNNAFNGVGLNTNVTKIYNYDNQVPDVGIEVLHLPDEYRGVPVTKINSNAISDSRPGNTNDGGTIAVKIKKIVLGSNVVELKQSAISKATPVDEFVFNDSLEILSNHCLWGVFKNTDKIVLPESINKIGMQVFTSDSTHRLNEITIQGSFESPEDGYGGGGYAQGYYICDNAVHTVFAETVASIKGRIINNTGDTLVFLHGENDPINLDIVAPKSAVNIGIYTDNTAVRNYDWASKNITVTFLPLSQYVGN